MRHLNHTRGFSLVEVMIALVISSLLLTGLVATFSNANSTYAELTKASRQIENGRYAISVLDGDLRHAGFWGEYTGTLAVRNPDSPPALVAPQPCADGPGEFLANLMVPIYGYDGGAAAPLGCLPNYRPDTDVLVVRRASTIPQTLPLALDANTVYFQGYLDAPLAPKGPYLDYGTAAPFDVTYPAGGPVPVRQFIERIYYIAKCRDCSGAGDGIPTLTRLDYTGNATFTVVPLAEGIEDLQIRYGVDNSGLNNGSPGSYEVAGTMALDPDWDSVMTVEINLLARNSTATRGYEDKKSYTLGDKIVPATGDGYRRHAFSQVVRLINPASKKEDFAP
jgi:type IV pilus assembly protein PilW